MSEQVGLVLETHGNKTAEVVTDRKDLCNGCADNSKCRMCLAGARLVETVQNTVGARPGDVVSICPEDAAFWTGTISLFIIPVLWMMTGAMIGAGLGEYWQIGETGGAVALGLSGFSIGLIMIAFISKTLRSILDVSPRILRVIEQAPKCPRQIGLFGRGLGQQV